MRKHPALLAVAAVGALALFASLGAGSVSSAVITAVSSPPPAATASASPAAGAAATTVGPDLGALNAMTQALATTSHDVVMRTKTSSVTGSVHPTTKAAAAVAKARGLQIDEVVQKGSVWIRANLGATLNNEVGISPHAWMRLDPDRISKANQLLLQPDGSDPVDMHGIMTGITSLQQVNAQHLRGVIDLTKVTGHTVPDPDELTKAGKPATHVPFTVTADTDGRITDFAVDANAFDAILSLDVAYSAYGAGTPVVAPPTSVPAPQTLYGVFNG
jgi:hypothetical protein